MVRLAWVLLTGSLLISCGCAGQAAAGSPAAGTPQSRDEALAKMDFRQVVQSAKDKVFPAVVYIRCLTESYQSGKLITEEVSGSGVIIKPTGELLTNWHVVDKAVKVRCLLYDGRALDANIVGTDKDTDLALVQLQMPKDSAPLPTATIGDSTKLKEGDFVMAMGAPWGLSRSVSIGIISCTTRYLPKHSEYSLWLQTDASISPGNSGGPLVNTDGQVIGINTRAIMQGGDMGFSIPASTFNEVVSQIRQNGKMNWSWTGLQLQPIKDFDRDNYFEGTEGVIVAETDPESPARHAGLEARDRIIKIDGQPVTAMTQEDLPRIQRLLGLLPKHKEVKIEVVRAGKPGPFALSLTPREKGRVEGEELDCPRWDCTVKAINQFDTPDLYFSRHEGVFIYGVKYPGNANSAGLETKDIIVQIDGKEITSLDDVKKIHKEAIAGVTDPARQPGNKHRVVLSILRNGLMKQLVLDYSRDYEKE